MQPPNSGPGVSIAYSSRLITSAISSRRDEYILVTKKELLMADTTIKSLDNISEVLKILGGILLGYTLNVLLMANRFENVLMENWVFLIIAIVLLAAGFYLKSKKTSTMAEILEMYK